MKTFSTIKKMCTIYKSSQKIVKFRLIKISFKASKKKSGFHSKATKIKKFMNFKMVYNNFLLNNNIFEKRVFPFKVY